MLEGDAVRSFTLMFLEMWNVAKSEKVEEFDPYLDVIYEREKHSGEGFVIPYGDSPIDGEHVGKMVYMDILNTSKRYVHIMTPYLILDNEMMTALKFAAKRGVEVIIIMPHVPDKWYAFVLAKTYYNELLDAGVQIYEYTPGFVHAKVLQAMTARPWSEPSTWTTAACIFILNVQLFYMRTVKSRRLRTISRKH